MDRHIWAEWNPVAGSIDIKVTEYGVTTWHHLYDDEPDELVYEISVALAKRQETSDSD